MVGSGLNLNVHLHALMTDGVYVLDDQGALRKHIRILVDGVAIHDLQKFNDAVRPNSEIWVMQALSGG